jgi:hypothetical protein
MLVRSDETNTQMQTKVVWPASAPVALAYVDQLTRSHAIQPERVRAIRTALDRADGVRSGDVKGATAAADQLDALSRQIDSDAGTASGRDAMRLKSLASTLKQRAAKLRG